jgi:hypothetical protein
VKIFGTKHPLNPNDGITLEVQNMPFPRGKMQCNLKLKAHTHKCCIINPRCFSNLQPKEHGGEVSMIIIA